MVMTLRSAVGIATIWLAAVTSVSATAWFAIDRAGRDLTGSTVSTLPLAQLTTPTPGSGSTTTEAAPHTQATPQTSAAPKPSGPPGPAATPTPTARTVSVQGGQVTVTCTGATIRLRTAQPENDWRVQVDTSEPGRVGVRFRDDDEEESQRTDVAAVCASGVPVFTVSNR